MSILRDAQKVIDVAEALHPRMASSVLWRVAKKRLLRSAVALETQWDNEENEAASDGPLEIKEKDKCDLGDQEAYSTDLKNMLTETLRRPLRVISRSSRVKIVPGRPKV